MTYSLSGHALDWRTYEVRLLLGLLGQPYERACGDLREELAPAIPRPRLAAGPEASWAGPDEILQALCLRHGPAWLGAATDEAAEVRRWVAFARKEAAILAELDRARLLEGTDPLDPGGWQAGVRALTRLDDHLVEGGLSGCDWIAGRRVTVADIVCFVAASAGAALQMPLGRWPELERWRLRLSRLPGFVPYPGMLWDPDGLASALTG